MAGIIGIDFDAKLIRVRLGATISGLARGWEGMEGREKRSVKFTVS